MEPKPLQAIKGGISRLRTEGAARSDVLYDLLNGYVTAAQTVVVRPGTQRMAVLPSDTKGLCAFQGKLHTFSTTLQDLDDPYVNHVITHPEDSSLDLAKIHFAEPFMGFLYVVAEYVNGDVYHYWLQVGGEWQANTVYMFGAIVEPTTPNGLAYKATRLGSPNPVWTANTQRVEGDIVEPIVYNGYYFTVTEVDGDNPASGATEPAWPTSEGATVEESETATDTSFQDAIDSGLSVYIDPSIADRYG